MNSRSEPPMGREAPAPRAAFGRRGLVLLSTFRLGAFGLGAWGLAACSAGPISGDDASPTTPVHERTAMTDLTTSTPESVPTDPMPGRPDLDQRAPAHLETATFALG